MAQAPFGRPLDEPDLRDDLRLQPAHFLHLLRRDAAAPMRRLAVRQIDEGTPLGVERRECREHLAPYIWCEASAHLPRKPKLCSVEIADEQRVDAMRTRTISADDELLLLVELQLEIGRAHV